MSHTITTQLELFPIPASNAERTLIRSGLRFYLTHCDSIPAPIREKYLTYYKLFYWSGSHLLRSIHNGTISRDGNLFTLRYTGNLTRGFILRNPDAQYSLSFRAVSSTWDLNPTVLISIAD